MSWCILDGGVGMVGREMESTWKESKIELDIESTSLVESVRM
jgi:hypothetical protein